ncbi:hypothetical protein [Streptomyces sp. S.PNR 29]|uniref:effector-associated constant component EACC1 n=1 Tax=Streptomyces sp. S.PNR 29 TaxID=2973805 RepID=UPI0025AF444C|nr:hypothetical protein [Streptomyces sp. S.PNR 29]MDN0194438.1 hypothetical protein [Streptomyces sp. S.PNR 29]
MDVRLRLPDDPDGGELKQLYDWLIRDQELHHHADISLRESGIETETDDTSMGGVLDIVQLVLESVLQLALLGAAIVEWRRALRPRSSIVIEHDGTTVTLPPDATPDEVQRFVDTLRDTDRPPEDPEDSPPAPSPEDGNR